MRLLQRVARTIWYVPYLLKGLADKYLIAGHQLLRGGDVHSWGNIGPNMWKVKVSSPGRDNSRPLRVM